MKTSFSTLVLFALCLLKVDLSAQCVTNPAPWKFEIVNWGWTQQIHHTVTPAQIQNTSATGSINFLNEGNLFLGGYGGMVTLIDTLCLDSNFAIDVRLRNRDNTGVQDAMAYDAVIIVTLANGVTLGCKVVGSNQAWAVQNTRLHFGNADVTNRNELYVNFNPLGGIGLFNGFNNIRLKVQGNTLTYSQVSSLGSSEIETNSLSVINNDPVCKTITKIQVLFKGAGELDRIQVRNSALTTTYLDEDFRSCTNYAQFPSCTEPSYNLTYVAPTCNTNRLQFSLASTPQDSTQYSWTGPAGFTSTMKNPFVDFPTSANVGTYTVTIRPKNPCEPTYTRSINVNFPTFPTPQTFNYMICPGQTINLPGGGQATQAGTYRDTLASSIAGCDSIIITNIILGEVIARTDTVLCSAGTVPLNAITNGFGYLWSPSTGLSDSLARNPIASVNATTTYTVTSALPNLNAPNLVQNPGFEAGNIDFTTNYGYNASIINGTGIYTIGANPTTYWNQLDNCSPHSGTSMMIVNGWGDSTAIVWCQTITVQPNTFYNFGFWVQRLRSSAANGVFQMMIDGVNVGGRMTMPVSNCSWLDHSASWFSGNNTSISFCIKNVSQSHDPDFAIDDIWFREMCTFTDVVNVTIQQPVANITASTNVSCFGGNNGSATATATGFAPFSYAWSNGVNTATASNFTAGTYIVTVTDSVGCVGRDTVTITAPSLLNVNFIDTTGISCFGAFDGSVTATASGGTAPYSYLWNTNPVQNGNILQNAGVGTYVVTVTDSNNCQANGTIVFTQPNQLTMSFSNLTSVSCYGGNDGSAEVTGNGGAGGFTYLWEDNSTGTQNTQLTGGWHSVVMTDANNCSITDSVQIVQPPVFSVLVSDSSNVSCFGMSDGKFSVATNGGTPTFTYTLNGQTATTTQFDSLSAGNYQIVVTDMNGCTASVTHVVSEPDSVHAAITANPSTGIVPATINLTSNSEGNTKQVWMLNGAPLDSNVTYSHLFNQAGEYDMILIATNDNGCPDTATVKIIISDTLHVIFPNVITPNGDGLNDNFDVKQVGVESIEITFFNRWGEIVNSAKEDNISTPVVSLWDGTVAFSGAYCSDGTYFYVAVIKDLKGAVKSVKGFVQVFK